MDEQNIATNVEADNSQVTATPATDMNVATNVETDNSNVINQATPMDSNTTYDNLGAYDEPPKQDVTLNPNMDVLQNAIQDAVVTDRDTNLNNLSGQAMDNFLTKEYNYDKNEAGTYWVAGAINDVDTQMSFLNTLIREDMYDQMDLEKYYYDTTLATARAYAAQKEKETAYGFYRAAQEKAIAEASLTGWYMPAEGNYMLGQYTIAQSKLEDPESSEEDRAKANRVIGITEKWFNANQISTKGIKCLSMMQYEETVRHNTIMGELQKQAQAIQAAGNAANNELAWAKLKFEIEEMELQSGVNYSKKIGIDNNDYLGHNVDEQEYKEFQGLDGAKNLEELAKDPYYYSALLGNRNSEWLKESLGDKNDIYQDNYNAYQNRQLLDSDEFKGVDSLQGQTFKLKNKTLEDGTVTNGTVKIVSLKNNGTLEKRVFVKLDDGSWKQLDWGTVCDSRGPLQSQHTLENGERVIGGLELQNGKRLGDYIKQEEFIPSDRVIDSVRVYDKVYNSKGERVYLNNYTGKSGAANTDGWNSAVRNQSVVNTINEYSKKGYVVKQGYYTDDKGFLNGEKQGIVMYNEKENKYISIGVTGVGIQKSGLGSAHEMSASNLKSIPNKDWGQLSDAQKEAVKAQMEYIGTAEGKAKSNAETRDGIIYAWKDGENNTHYTQFVSTKNKEKYDIDEAMASKPKTVTKEYAIKYSNEETLINYENRQEEYNNSSTSTRSVTDKSTENKKDTKEKETPQVLDVDANQNTSVASKNSGSNAEQTRVHLFAKYDIPEDEQPKFNSITNTKELEDKLEEYKSINNVLGRNKNSKEVI